MKYVKIKLHGGGSYVQPINSIGEAVVGELDCLEIGDKITLDLEFINITDEEYEKLPEFAGH